MYRNKKVLLIAGGGTLGGYTAKELLRLGASVDVVCLEDHVSDHPKLRFFKNLATKEFLSELFRDRHYDGIVNFIHYKDAEEYKRIHPFLIENTDHLIFLSSYRVYADEQHPITEDAPRLYDVVDDPVFLKTESYAVPKSICEDYLRGERKNDPWTIVRPVISFSHLRLDLVLYSRTKILEAAEQGRELILPSLIKDYSAGIDWAGNSGKLIANLLFRREAIGEAFTVYSGHGMTWGEVAEAYQRQTGVKIRWCDEEEFVASRPSLQKEPWMWIYDRRFDRRVDASKILRVTGLGKDDFCSVEDGIRRELDILNWQKPQ